MLKLSRLTDYGTVVLAHMARAPTERHRASELALATRLGEATVRKLLKLLVHGGIVVSLPVKVELYYRADLIVAVHLDYGDAARPPRVMAVILEQSHTFISRAMVDQNIRSFHAAHLVVLR